MSTQRLSSMDLFLSVCECVFVWKTGAYAIEEYTQRSSDKELDEVKSSFNACLFVTYSKRYRRRPWCHHRHLKNSVDVNPCFFCFFENIQYLHSDRGSIKRVFSYLFKC